MKRLSWRAFLCVLAGLSVQAAALTGGPIPWRSGTVPLNSPKSQAPLDGLTGEVVVQFGAHPSPEQVEALQANGISILNYVAENAWFARIHQGAKQGAGGIPPIVGIERVRVEWKLHPALLTGDPSDYALVPNPFGSSEDKNGKSARRLALYVMLHGDADVEAEGRRLVERYGVVLRSRVETVHALVVEAPPEAVRPLAADASVQWVEPALPPLTEANDGNRQRTQAGQLQAPPYNLDGSGIEVLLLDVGVADANHPDFGGRLTARSGGDVSGHATHVGGTIGGDGSGSAASGGVPHQWRGMAPGVVIESYRFGASGTDIFLFTDPGNFEEVYTEAIRDHGVDIANNSLSSNVAENGFDCGILGDYGVTASLIDSLVRGADLGPFRVVWAGGNERGETQCGQGFASIPPPAGAKNHIAVGAIHSDTEAMTNFSSWGPTDDGRLKPDLCAPGDQEGEDGGVTSLRPGDGYGVRGGTSMAAPTVTGICALLMEDFRVQFPDFNNAAQDPRNSTLKVLLAHTAVDLGNPGPDYKFGYGSIRAKDAVEFMRSGRFLEDSIADGEVKAYNVNVAAGDTLQATLAWDDVPGTPNVVTALVNDIDIVAVSPSGVVHFPWGLDPAAPDTPASRSVPDHINNMEQIYVELPEQGAWQLLITGHSVPRGPQFFSLAVSPTLVACANRGAMLFSATAYTCDDLTMLLLTDCHLDLDPSRPDAVTVRVRTTSDPEGENLVLREAGNSTALFRGFIGLSPEEGPGMLLAADGDTILAEYADFDDGTGAPVLVTAEVPVDCNPPQIFDITVEPSARTAIIRFETDEPSRTSVSYGTDCGVWSGAGEEFRFNTHHEIIAKDLMSETKHFFIVTASDVAGNTIIDYNQGGCYSFTTGVRADYFTELFGEAPLDLANSTLTLIPNDSLSGYFARLKRNVSGLPTESEPGTPVSLEDDDSTDIALAEGRTVLFYGEEYDGLWIGANGYLNLARADTIQVPSFAHHFNSPRVSGLFLDLDPSEATGGGVISWRQLDNHVAFTWADVEEWDVPENRNTFQIRMFFHGPIDITWLTLGSDRGISGLSPGGGVPSDFVASDLSAYPAPGLILFPIGDKWVGDGDLLEFEVRAESELFKPTVTASNLPGSATFENMGDGVGLFRWQTEAADIGEYANVRFVAQDLLNSAQETITIRVGPAGDLPPLAVNVALFPPSPGPDDTLASVYTYFSPAQRPEGPTEIRWFRDDELMPSLNDARIVPSDLTANGETWFFTVRPHDGIQPGELQQSLPAMVRHPMDVDGDGFVTALDVQRVINAALGIAAEGNEDVNNDGQVNAVDIQLVINASLGIF